MKKRPDDGRYPPVPPTRPEDCLLPIWSNKEEKPPKYRDELSFWITALAVIVAFALLLFGASRLTIHCASTVGPLPIYCAHMVQ
jgi:hypothetical protein